MPQSDRRANANASWRRTSRLALFVLCLAIVRHAFAEPKPTAALIDLDKSAVAGLLESRLLTDDSVRWVERTEIDRVLKEQQLQTAFGASGVKERSSLGKLLKADLLILVRETDSLDKKTRLIECVVCETKQGLRLRVSAVPLDKDTEKTTTALEAVAQAGLKKSREEIKDIVAVSPLVSDDLRFQYNYLQTAYAKIIEQVLLDVPGIVVVELGEAQAIVKELALSKEPVLQRRQPLYVLGNFRQSGAGDEQTVAIGLALLRGAEQLEQVKAAGLSGDSAAAWLREQSLLLLGAGESSAKARSTQEEGKQLGARALEFSSVSNWEEAIALLEAGLLIDSQNQTLRHDIVVAIGRHARAVGNRIGDKDRFNLWSQLHERGMWHLERYLERADKLPLFYGGPEPDFITEFDFAFVGFAHSKGADAELNSLFSELRKRRFDGLMRMARMRVRKGFLEEACLLRATWFLPNEERLEHSVAFVEEFAESDDLDEIAVSLAPRQGILLDQPIVHEYVKRLDQSRSERVRASAAAVRKALAVAPKIDTVRPKATPLPLSNKYFKPIDVDTEIPSRSPYERPYLQGCVAVGPKLDVFWTRTELFSMSEPGKLRKLHATPVGQFQHVVWDGRYVWATVVVDKGPHSLLAIDPASEKVRVFASKDGLPVDPDSPGAAMPRLLVTPLEPGRVCVAGAAGRTWIATATVGDDGRQIVEVVHEAREAPDPEKPEQALSVTVAFEPILIALLTAKEKSGHQGRRVLIARRSLHQEITGTPLILDVDRKRVELAEFKSFPLVLGNGPTVFNGSLYMQDGFKSTPALARVDYPGKKVVLLDACPRGELWCNEHGVHVFGPQVHLLAPGSQELSLFAGEVPWREGGNPPEFALMGVAASSHYGLIAITSGGPQPSGKLFRYVPSK